ncbi:MAG: NfeD family protein [Deltaproteobacteria bacterium]|nr:NfeD family protein [Deltaproteobacteria bacterium]
MFSLYNPFIEISGSIIAERIDENKGLIFRLKDKITKGTVIRYSLFQIPALAILIIAMVFVRRWINVPHIIFYGIIFAWILKDVILFFYTWRAYIPKKEDMMIGKRGITLERITDAGYITINGEKWKAQNKSESPIEEGQEIFVIERKGLTLLVKPSGFENAERMQPAERDT